MLKLKMMEVRNAVRECDDMVHVGMSLVRVCNCGKIQLVCVLSIIFFLGLGPRGAKGRKKRRGRLQY